MLIQQVRKNHTLNNHFQSDFYSKITKGYYSKVESIMTKRPTEEDEFNTITELVFHNPCAKIIDSFEYNFWVTSTGLFLEMRKQDLIKMMLKFRLPKKEIERQLLNQFTTKSLTISFVDKL